MPAATLKANDECVLPFAPEPIWAVIADIEDSPRWWPASIKLTVLSSAPGIVGSEFEICPRGGRPFRSTVESIDPPRRMVMRYGNGFVTGTGEWLLTPVPGGTRVGYSVDLLAHGWIMAVLGSFLPLANIHSRSMQEVLTKLEAEVQRRT